MRNDQGNYQGGRQGGQSLHAGRAYGQDAIATLASLCFRAAALVVVCWVNATLLYYSPEEAAKVGWYLCAGSVFVLIVGVDAFMDPRWD